MLIRTRDNITMKISMAIDNTDYNIIYCSYQYLARYSLSTTEVFHFYLKCYSKSYKYMLPRDVFVASASPLTALFVRKVLVEGGNERKSAGRSAIAPCIIIQQNSAREEVPVFARMLRHTTPR